MAGADIMLTHCVLVIIVLIHGCPGMYIIQLHVHEHIFLIIQFVVCNI